MESIKLLDIIYEETSHDSVQSMYQYAHETLQVILLRQRDNTISIPQLYEYIGPTLATVMMKHMTRQFVEQYLQSKVEYKIDQRPLKRLTWRWSSIQARYTKWQMDLLDVRRFNMGGVAYILSVIDTFTKYGFLFPLASKRGKEVALHLQSLFQRQGPEFKPKLLLSDEGKEFQNKNVNRVCKSNKVFQLYSYPYSPLGIIERFGQTIKRKLRKRMSKGRVNVENFPAQIMNVLREYNETIHSTTRQRPIVLHFAQRPRRWVKKMLQSTASRIRSIASKQMNKARMQTIALAVGQSVRVLVWKDPRLSKKEQYKKRKKFTYKKFAMSYWTREVFEIASFEKGYHYRLKDFATDWFVREDLQKVSTMTNTTW
jgi:transposase InsO family protein